MHVALANAVQKAKFLNQLCKDMKVSIDQGKSLSNELSQKSSAPPKNEARKYKIAFHQTGDSGRKS